MNAAVTAYRIGMSPRTGNSRPTVVHRAPKTGSSTLCGAVTARTMTIELAVYHDDAPATLTETLSALGVDPELLCRRCFPLDAIVTHWAAYHVQRGSAAPSPPTGTHKTTLEIPVAVLLSALLHEAQHDGDRPLAGYPETWAQACREFPPGLITAWRAVYSDA